MKTLNEDFIDKILHDQFENIINFKNKDNSEVDIDKIIADIHVAMDKGIAGKTKNIPGTAESSASRRKEITSAKLQDRYDDVIKNVNKDDILKRLGLENKINDILKAIRKVNFDKNYEYNNYYHNKYNRYLDYNYFKLLYDNNIKAALVCTKPTDILLDEKIFL